MRIHGLTVCMAAMALISGGPARAGVIFYTNEAAWLDQVRDLEPFNTTASNIALADEIASPPGENGDLGSSLTFPSSTTGLAQTFQLRSINVAPPLPRGLVFNDSGEAGVGGPRNISIGDANGVGENDPNRALYENDDFEIKLLSGRALTALAFFLIGNQNSNEEQCVVEYQGTQLGALTTIPTTGASGVVFIGVISDTPFDRILYDSGSIGDDIAIRDFRFALAVPEPSALALLAVAAMAAGARPLSRKLESKRSRKPVGA